VGGDLLGVQYGASEPGPRIAGSSPRKSWTPSNPGAALTRYWAPAS